MVLRIVKEMEKKNYIYKGKLEAPKSGIAKDWKIQQLLEVVPGARSVPQIFVDDKYIGGYNELVEFFNEQ